MVIIIKKKFVFSGFIRSMLRYRVRSTD